MHFFFSNALLATYWFWHTSPLTICKHHHRATPSPSNTCWVSKHTSDKEETKFTFLPMLCWQDNRLTVSTGNICMPSILATWAEFQMAGRAFHQHRLIWVTGCYRAYSLTVCNRAPCPVGVQVNFWSIKKENVVCHFNLGLPTSSFILLYRWARMEAQYNHG